MTNPAERPVASEAGAFGFLGCRLGALAFAAHQLVGHGAPGAFGAKPAIPHVRQIGGFRLKGAFRRAGEIEIAGSRHARSFG
ncbi:hypothetical protein Swit_4647 [Rhizorhabdus wittichii RW1]|uniref:Uncharacterized protein n=1 Tax=Rhizorhabdus wittichii (strain DSM 6014 / CCUG 31198 / JCM 15750 / NBRC 105917 / EY 4224 / RW1) TaxID=392499 RepID=A0A9J9LFW6_RHIWR|nr:hypothetical protein Swit_4647 [Rhizorhabdus wittichii RW1]